MRRHGTGTLMAAAPGCTCGHCGAYTPPQGMCAGALKTWRDEMAGYAAEDIATGDHANAAKSAAAAANLSAELARRGGK